METYSKERLVRLFQLFVLMAIAAFITHRLLLTKFPLISNFGFATVIALCPVLRKAKVYIPLALLCAWQPIFLAVIGYMSVCWFIISVMLILLYEAAPEFWKERHFSQNEITRFIPDVYGFTHIECSDKSENDDT